VQGAPKEIDGGTVVALLVEHHSWEKAVSIFRTWTTVEQALKKYITAFEPMYLEILNNYMVGFANTTAREMIANLFLSYGSITAVGLDHNWENMRQAWDPQKPAESLFKHIQDCVDYAEAGGGSPSARHKSSRLCTPRSLQLESSTVLAAVGMADLLQSRLGMRSTLTLQWPIFSTIKCRGGELLPPGTPTPLWHNLLMKI
jgi:hypothetical protein